MNFMKLVTKAYYATADVARVLMEEEDRKWKLRGVVRILGNYFPEETDYALGVIREWVTPDFMVTACEMQTMTAEIGVQTEAAAAACCEMETQTAIMKDDDAVASTLDTNTVSAASSGSAVTAPLQMVGYEGAESDDLLLELLDIKALCASGLKEENVLTEIEYNEVFFDAYIVLRADEMNSSASTDTAPEDAVNGYNDNDDSDDDVTDRIDEADTDEAPSSSSGSGSGSDMDDIHMELVANLVPDMRAAIRRALFLLRQSFSVLKEKMLHRHAEYANAVRFNKTYIRAATFIAWRNVIPSRRATRTIAADSNGATAEKTSGLSVDDLLKQALVEVQIEDFTQKCIDSFESQARAEVYRALVLKDRVVDALSEYRARKMYWRREYANAVTFHATYLTANTFVAWRHVATTRRSAAKAGTPRALALYAREAIQRPDIYRFLRSCSRNMVIGYTAAWAKQMMRNIVHLGVRTAYSCSLYSMMRVGPARYLGTPLIASMIRARNSSLDGIKHIYRAAVERNMRLAREYKATRRLRDAFVALKTVTRFRQWAAQATAAAQRQDEHDEVVLRSSRESHRGRWTYRMLGRAVTAATISCGRRSDRTCNRSIWSMFDRRCPEAPRPTRTGREREEGIAATSRRLLH